MYLFLDVGSNFWVVFERRTNTIYRSLINLCKNNVLIYNTKLFLAIKIFLYNLIISPSFISIFWMSYSIVIMIICIYLFLPCQLNHAISMHVCAHKIFLTSQQFMEVTPLMPSSKLFPIKLVFIFFFLFLPIHVTQFLLDSHVICRIPGFIHAISEDSSTQASL